jgi:uncharacterized protein YciI
MLQWMYFLIAPRNTFADDANEFESRKMGEHFQYLKQLLDQDVLIMAGRTQDRPPLGLAIFEAVAANR